MSSLESIFENIINKKVKSFIIHLKNANDRIKLVHKLSLNTNSNIEIIDAVDGNSNINIANIYNKCPYTKNNYRSNGEIACLLSHINIWKKIINENIDYAIIYEDDCCFINSLKEIEIILNKNKDIILNSDCFLLGALTYRNSAKIINNDICKVSMFDGTHAILLTNYLACKLIEFYEKEQIKGYLHPADGHFFSAIKEYNLNMYGFRKNNKYFIQNKGPSYIANSKITKQ
jgi:GR25 family glycosyltransferase involved in LPS biosynthesis